MDSFYGFLLFYGSILAELLHQCRSQLTIDLIYKANFLVFNTARFLILKT